MNQHRPVVVVGAGPVGLTAALALRSLGMPATVLEAEREGRPRPGSRAIYIHKATLTLLEELSPGLGHAFAKHGLVWPIKRTLFQGQEVYMKKYDTPKPNEIPPFSSLPQNVIESLLYQACLEAGVEFEWGTPIKDVKTDENGATLTTKSGAVWTADYVIAADGARSAVRKAVGIEMEGPRTNDFFLVVDVKEDEDNPLPLERIFHYQHPAMSGRNVMFVPFAGHWRVDLQLLEGDDAEEYGGIEGVKKWLPRVMDAKYADRITWVSTYQFYQVVAKSFTDSNKRVLLAGEAAHLFAPFGARGLNSGVPDAIIAAKSIYAASQVTDLVAASDMITAGAEERRIAALYNRDASSTALEHIQGNSAYMNMKREIAASLSPIVPRLGRWLDEGPYGPKSGPPQLSTKY
ncbi:FAD-dependent monooxygenase [Brevibacillus choshinensis]|uniref:FAD-dependent monooxygenase n=1 Tax=Brevibacillus choshinensis TaxID=54911 RepID=UPI002E1D4A73|nr:FAD-dependent monooxygenase [Brevibacillus choshinensis]MED4779949.1 FAD-dependent monooxygenase [Brevibacillus choshinensis]